MKLPYQGPNLPSPRTNHSIRQYLIKPTFDNPRKIRRLFRWMKQVTGVDKLWIEGIDKNKNPLWGLAQQVKDSLWYVVSRAVKPALVTSSIALCLALPPNDANAQTGRDLNTLNGNNGVLLEGINDADEAGTDVATGDVNGDGIEDLIIGADYADPNGNESGETYVVFGDDDGFSDSIQLSSLDGSNGFTINGEASSDYSGRAVGTVDINGDGIDDIVVGAPEANSQTGKAYVIYGKSSGFSSTIELSSLSGTDGFVINGRDVGDFTGNAFAAGDIDGDGFEDLMIGAQYGGGAGAIGEVSVIHGKSGSFSSPYDLSGITPGDGFTIYGESNYDEIGADLASGDINGDGFDDIIMGSTDNSTGKAYVLFGKGSDFSTSYQLSNMTSSEGMLINGVASADKAGHAVASGNINGDNADDVLIGAPGAGGTSYGDPKPGRSYVVFGSANSLPGTLDLSSLDGSNGFRIDGDADDDKAGESIAAADINGDGYDDVIVGANWADANGTNNSGKVYTVFGKNSGFAASIDVTSLDGSTGFVLNSTVEMDYSAAAVTSGDINGDGFDDVVNGAVGYTGYSPGPNTTGRAHIFFNARAQKITGSAGFRTMGAPASGQIYHELLDHLWTQGFTNSDIPGAPDPNVWTWDETAGTEGEWSVLNDQKNSSLAAGQGFIFYIFSDDDSDQDPEGFPKYISALEFGGDGALNTGSINPVSNLGDERFFLAANPYDQTIDWDELTTSNLMATMYVYDHSSSSWIQWNGSTGNLTDGLIAPFQGFFIQGNGSNGSLTIEEADIAGSEGAFYKQHKTEPLSLELELQSGERSNKAWLQFDKQGSPDRDRWDGLELQPLTDSYLQLFTESADGTALNINALPVDQNLKLPLKMLNIQSESAATTEGTLRWNGLDAFPEDWSITLIDQQSDREWDLRKSDNIPVEIETTPKTKITPLDKPRPKEISSARTSDRYTIKIQPGTTTNTNAQPEQPVSVQLHQNYPNPFNPATKISFELPQRSEIRLAIYDMSGRELEVLARGTRSAGRHAVHFNAGDLASGIYMYKLHVGNRVFTKKLTLLK